jgi:hypothetical protein
MPSAEASVIVRAMSTVLAPSYTRTELAVRQQQGTCVTLYWTRETNLLAVVVDDFRSDESFEFVLDPDEPPLDVFYHPYAYAAKRGLVLDV